MRLYWDTESANPKLDDESWDDYRLRAGVGLAVVYNDTTDDWLFYTEGDLDALAEKLEAADEVWGYNSVGYDHVVLDQALGRRIYIPGEMDLYLKIRDARGHIRDPKGTWKLTEVCRRTLGRGKTANGAGAPFMIKNGRWGELVTYCANDVKLVRDLHRFILQYGYVLDGSDQKVMIGERKTFETSD